VCSAQAFKGRWLLEAQPAQEDQCESTLLRYEIQVVPQLNGVPLPRALLTYLLEQGLPANLSAVAAHAERIAQVRAHLACVPANARSRGS